MAINTLAAEIEKSASRSGIRVVSKFLPEPFHKVSVYLNSDPDEDKVLKNKWAKKRSKDFSLVDLDESVKLDHKYLLSYSMNCSSTAVELDTAIREVFGSLVDRVEHTLSFTISVS